MNYEPLDSLPYIDDEITEEDRLMVQELINEELKGQTFDKIHEKVEELYPLPDVHTLIREIPKERLESEDFTLGGIDLSHYSNIDDLDSLKKSISYTYLKQNLLKILSKYGKSQWLISNDLLEHSNETLNTEITNKKRKITEINQERKKQQLEAEPVINHLNQRWQESISKNVEIGVEILKLKYGELGSQ